MLRQVVYRYIPAMTITRVVTLSAPFVLLTGCTSGNDDGPEPDLSTVRPC